MTVEMLPHSSNLDVVAKWYTNLLGTSEAILQLYKNRPLRVGTMCSSTVETTAFVRALSKASGRKSLIDHIVSCGYDLRKRDSSTINFPTER